MLNSVGLAALLILVSCLLSGRPSQAASLETLDIEENLVLIDRLEQMRVRQMQILQRCAQNPEDLRLLRELSITPGTVRPTQKKDPQVQEQIRRQVFSLMQGLRDRTAQVNDCQIKRRARPHALGTLSPRRYVPGQVAVQMACANADSKRECLRDTAQMWAQIQPHCFQSLRTGMNGLNEKYACFAADPAMDEALRHLAPGQKHRQVFIAGEIFLAEARRAEAHSVLELEVLGEDETNRYQTVLALIAALGSSGTSAMTGWLQSLEDRWLAEGLLSDSPLSQVFVEYKLLQQGKIRYQLAREILNKKNVRLSFGGQEVTHWNRHNFMAAFLGCHFRELKHDHVRRLVRTLGIGYESTDFLSHLLEGHSFSRSLENFRQDTRRYSESGSLGLALCASEVGRH